MINALNCPFDTTFKIQAVPISLKFVGSHEVAPLYQTAGSNAVDLLSDERHPVTLFPSDRKKIRTGIAVHIGDPGIAGLLVGRSGLGLNHGVKPAQGVGLIDSDYTGEICVPLENTDPEEAYTINPGDRIAQLLFVVTQKAHFLIVPELPSTGRGAGGFGHTGV